MTQPMTMLDPAKEGELLSIAFDPPYTHMYAPGTRRHTKSSLALGATVEEIMEILKLCVDGCLHRGSAIEAR